jgi:hypothetical protein
MDGLTQVALICGSLGLGVALARAALSATLRAARIASQMPRTDRRVSEPARRGE